MLVGTLILFSGGPGSTSKNWKTARIARVESSIIIIPITAIVIMLLPLLTRSVLPAEVRIINPPIAIIRIAIGIIISCSHSIIFTMVCTKALKPHPSGSLGASVGSHSATSPCAKTKAGKASVDKIKNGERYFWVLFIFILHQPPFAVVRLLFRHPGEARGPLVAGQWLLGRSFQKI